VPQFVFDAVKAEPIEGAVVGSGHDEDEHLAKELAALDCLWKLEEHCARRLPGILKLYQKQQRVRIEQWDIAQELPGVSWQNLPLDRAFPRRGSRWERLTFTPALIQNTKAFATAKAITLASKETLPEVILKKNKDTQRDTHINIKTNSQRHGVLSVRGPGFTKPFADDMIPELRRELALQDALQRIHHQMVEEKHGTHLLELLEKSNPSFGMAKLFVALPDHHVKRLISLLRYTIKNPLPRPSPLELITPRQRRQPITAETTTTAAAADDDDAVQLKRRIEALRRHQRAHPLPVDDVENQIPHDALVTIVQGGTGSGKTTRYPLLLSLFGDGGTAATGTTTPPRVVVAQPRRLACQAAAERVAYEQGYYESFISSSGGNDNDDDCPIGYAIRFDGQRARGRRTVEFATPGVLLRRAVADPWMEDVTHLGTFVPAWAPWWFNLELWLLFFRSIPLTHTVSSAYFVSHLSCGRGARKKRRYRLAALSGQASRTGSTRSSHSLAAATGVDECNCRGVVVGAILFIGRSQYHHPGHGGSTGRAAVSD